tara:strand:- start:98 stop:310 length:213 start_codon:yes stop_codon:yes gene_type:complete
MAQNKLKLKVEGLTNVLKQVVKEVQRNADIAQGTLTALQVHVGKEEWDKIVEELKDREKRHVEQKLEKGD